MKKKIILRSLLGFPLGVFLGYTITILISAIAGNGNYVPCMPQLVEDMGSEIGAVLLQFILSGLLGTACAGGSAVFEMEHWGITKQTIVHFIVLSFSMLPIAYFSHWMEHSVVGFLLYFGVFISLYIVVWLIQYSVWKKRITQMNKKLRQNER